MSPEEAGPGLSTEPIECAGFASRAIVTEGDPTRPAFLFLHGFSDSADGWRRLQRRIGKAGHRTLAVDQPSHGKADRLREDEPVIGQFVSFAADAARQTASGGGEQPVIVVGNSLGGAHSLLLAQHHPDLVAGVVAISPASFDHPNWFRVLDDDTTVDRLRARGERVIQRAEQEADSESRARRILRTRVANAAIRNVAFGAPWRAPDGFVRDLRRQFRDPDRRDALRSLAGRFRDEYLNESPIDLGAIEAPVMALWGTRDRLVHISSRRTLEAGLGDLEFVRLPSIGHMPQLEAPGRTTKHVLRFADRIMAISGGSGGTAEAV